MAALLHPDVVIEIVVCEVKSFVAAHPGIKVVFVVRDGDADGGKSMQARCVKRWEAI